MPPPRCVTGLGAVSLNNAFGDKRALFARCLDRHLDGNMRARTAKLEATLPPRAAIETFLNDITARSITDAHGCLLVNSALEVPKSLDDGHGAACRTSEGLLHADGDAAGAAASLRSGCALPA